MFCVKGGMSVGSSVESDVGSKEIMDLIVGGKIIVFQEKKYVEAGLFHVVLYEIIGLIGSRTLHWGMGASV